MIKSGNAYDRYVGDQVGLMNLEPDNDFTNKVLFRFLFL
jgi:hypothetical protein